MLDSVSELGSMPSKALVQASEGARARVPEKEAGDWCLGLTWQVSLLELERMKDEPCARLQAGHGRK